MGVLLLAFATYRVFHLIHLPHLSRLAEVSYQPITGHAYWRAFQNRLLAPALLYAIKSATGVDLVTTFKLFSATSIAILLFIAYFLLNKRGASPVKTFLYTGGFAFFFLIFQDQNWMLAWDFIDVLVFLFFFYGIFSDRDIGYFLLLFIVGIANRESALFIPVWLILDGIRLTPLNSYEFHPFKFSVGSLTLIGGSLYTWWIRDLLFIRSHVDHIGTDASHTGISNHWNLPVNLQTFYDNVLYLQMDFLGPLFMLLIISCLAYHRSQYNEREMKAAILIGGIILSICLFGLINEMRQYMLLLPACLFFVYEIRQKSNAIKSSPDL